MTLQTLSPTALASAVWQAATRTLTSFGGGCIRDISGYPFGIPASTTVIFGPAASHYWNATICITAGAGGSVVISLNYNSGASIIPMKTIAAGQSDFVTVSLMNSTKLQITNNDPVNLVNMLASGVDFN